MNWKRGFSRLWILCSIGWIVLMGALASSQIEESIHTLQAYHEGEKELTPFSHEGTLLFPIETDKLGSNVPANALKVDRFTMLPIEDIRSRFPQYNDWNDTELRKNLYCKFFDESTDYKVAHEAATRMRCGWIAEAEWHTLRVLAMMVFLPPLVALLVGIAAAWVMRGFRAKPT